MDFEIRGSPYPGFRKSPITRVRANLEAGLRRVPPWGLEATSDPGTVAGVGPSCWVTAIAGVDASHKAGMPAMVWGAVLPEITYSHKYVEVTRVTGTMISQNNVAADFAVKTLGFKAFAR